MSRNFTGSAVKLKSLPRGVKGIARATIRIITIFNNSSLLGLLRKNGIFLVLMANITSVCVNNDSINQAVWNSGADALKTYIITKNVRKSKIELMGPKDNIKFLIKDVCNLCGLWTYVWSILSVGRVS